MEASALIKATGGLMMAIDKSRHFIISHAARLEEFNHMTRRLRADRKDPRVEQEALKVRKDMRAVLREVEDLGTKFGSIHATVGVHDERLAEHSARLLVNARNIHRALTDLTDNAKQAHTTLQSFHCGTLGWNIHHDAQLAEEATHHIVKVCQRLVNATQVQI